MRVVKQTIVMVTERHLFPVRQGNRARIIELIRSLRAAGFRVVLVSRAIRSWPKRLRTRLLVDRLIEVSAAQFQGGRIDNYDAAQFLPAVREAVGRHSAIAVIAQYVWLAPTLEAVPAGVLKLVDTHDLMHVRSGIYGGLEQGAWVDCSAEEEARMLDPADVVIAIQRQELAQFQRMLPGKRVVCVPHFCPPAAPRRSRRRRDVVSFIGSRIQGNVVGMQAFLEQAWPVVRELRPGAELRVYGTVVDGLPRGVAGTRMVGPVRRAGDAYTAATVVINPVTLGTGLKIKTVEALAHGRALVTTPCGAEGLEDGRGEAFVVESDLAPFGAAVADLLSDDERRRTLEASALAFSRERFSREAVLKELLQTLALHGARRSGEVRSSGTVPAGILEIPG
jgi:glycosyltransferase involved in cell wall biosynthesis